MAYQGCTHKNELMKQSYGLTKAIQENEIDEKVNGL
jgi:hypothetical protein